MLKRNFEVGDELEFEATYWGEDWYGERSFLFTVIKRTPKTITVKFGRDNTTQTFKIWGAGTKFESININLIGATDLNRQKTVYANEKEAN